MLLPNINSNRELFEFTKKNLLKNFKFEYSIRDAIFHFKFLLFRFALGTFVNADFNQGHPFLPGLEMYKSIQYATQNKTKIEYLGEIMDEANARALKLETRLNFMALFKRYYYDLTKKTSWFQEYNTYANLCADYSLADLSEYFDKYDINTINGIFENLAPEQKHILVDRTNERIIRSVINNDFKNGVMVVNLFNMPHIETLWREHTGTQLEKSPINPIGDFDINQLQEQDLINDYLRRRASLNSRSEPTVTCNYIVQYHKMNTEPERDRHAQFKDYKDPELEHSLYNNENKDVKDLPYKIHH